MQKWEYIVKIGKKEIPQGTGAMNDIGDEGWELVAIVRHDEPDYWVYYYYFKRPKI